MDIENFREICISKSGVTEEFPFDNQTLVFKVMSKMFALIDVDLFERANLKCDPERAVQLREQYDGIKPGYHMNKKHWNTVMMDGSVPDPLIIELVEHSYELVVAGLPKKLKEELDKQNNTTKL
ncbi:MmcQ/YjbR family DNA-binding protein [Fulvivirga sp. 29W222]|uniref:MmcQ/YjbR family DNA-binding protein n=1 Tax=Fulvivirga marina TaxID=2494733 RepID=A0A937KCK6_9BACT|nr:MmcQ/YjbR family DNA-binding protein [Fulvivirga marina]MBL6445070.1 MmcQ/YjbR family DNA-binding protein [Fulvivirga marina]